MLLSIEQQTIVQNLPIIVSDLDALDVIDHLTAATPPMLTSSDYESVILSNEKHGRSAGVRCLISCLLRRSLDANLLKYFITLLMTDYQHLANRLSATYENLVKSKRKIVSNVFHADHMNSISDKNLGNHIATLCQIDPSDQVVSDHMDQLQMNFLLSVFDIIYSHPLAVINWKTILLKLALSNDYIEKVHVDETKLSDFQIAAVSLKHGLLYYFSVNLIRKMENRMHPTNSSQSKSTNSHIVRQLVLTKLVPALQQCNLWELARRVQSHTENMPTSSSCTDTPNCALKPCGVNCNKRVGDGPTIEKNCLCLNIEHQLHHTAAESLLMDCIDPLLQHSLIHLDWPFLLRELNVCSSCIIQLVIDSSNCTASTSLEMCNNPPVNNDTMEDRKTMDKSGRKWKSDSLVHCLVSILNIIICRQLAEQENSQSVTSQNVEKCSVSCLILSKLAPALNKLNLKALSEELVQRTVKIIS